ncbi:MAG: hypothetical protein CME70_14025 [Halobacteriovorax sp.]|nr:hypothetical protein [Halobacteriovorax sp.]|tara:strand:+ start:479 stop:832 length:354 start_codon:yes stop_codon:yes gene_type:complete
MKRNKQIFNTLQRQDKYVSKSILNQLELVSDDQYPDITAESRIRTIIREELGHNNQDKFPDPLNDAIRTVEALQDEAKKSPDSMNIKLIKEYIKSLNELLPEISEEFEIIRDVISST